MRGLVPGLAALSLVGFALAGGLTPSPSPGLGRGELIAVAEAREGAPGHVEKNDVRAAGRATGADGATRATGGDGVAEGFDPEEELRLAADAEPTSLEEQRERLFGLMRRGLKLSDDQEAVIRMVFAGSPYLGQGNPELTRHPMTRLECRRKRAEAAAPDEGDARCGAPYMVPLYNKEEGEGPEQASVCIDRFEFPGVPCEYPVTYARASEAVILCRAVGKRLCDAHEWEGACAGSLRPFEEEYALGRSRMEATYQHNGAREKVWAYGPSRDGAACGTNGWRSPGCTGEWTKCGSNTYPAGSFPGCVSPLGVFDLHGNAAEHMNLPLTPEERASAGDNGWTEMKGSWFGFSGALPHEDDCRWRAPDWHETRTLNTNSHRNYHLSFRCCRDL